MKHIRTYKDIHKHNDDDLTIGGVIGLVALMVSIGIMYVMLLVMAGANG